MTSLTDLAVGARGRVRDLAGTRVERCKLLDMGLVPGTFLQVRKIAPMGDPLELQVRSYVLTLRKDEAALIEVEPLEGAAAAGEGE